MWVLREQEMVSKIERSRAVMVRVQKDANKSQTNSV
jgi:hypothetical protein